MQTHTHRRAVAVIPAAMVVGLFLQPDAIAAPLSGAEILARAGGGEFRGDTATLRGFESHIWRFGPGGTMTGIGTAKRAPGNFSSTIEFADSGQWRVEGDMLCVEWAAFNRQFSGCYAVEGQEGDHVRMIGPARWEGTLAR